MTLNLARVDCTDDGRQFRHDRGSCGVTSISTARVDGLAGGGCADREPLASDRPLLQSSSGLGNYFLANSSHRIAAEALKRGDAASARAAIRADIDRARSMS
jgi:hypothetical protein